MIYIVNIIWKSFWIEPLQVQICVLLLLSLMENVWRRTWIKDNGWVADNVGQIEMVDW